jgi:hypothetical protein
VTPHERAMEELALRLVALNQIDGVPTTTPPTGDDSEDTK